jgi:transposase
MEKSHFNPSTGQFLFSKYKIIKGLHVLNDACWVFDQRSLNFKKKKYWHLSDLISTIRLWNRHDLWNMRVDSRTRKIVKQKEHRSGLQNLDRSDINTSRHFLKSWTAGAIQWTLKRKNKQYSDQLGGNKKMIKRWIGELRTMEFKER